MPRRLQPENIWSSGLWLPITLKDAVEYCRQHDLCQQMGQPNGKDRMPHQPALPLQPL